MEEQKIHGFDERKTVRRIIALRNRIQRDDAEKKQLEDELKAWMLETKTADMTVGSHKVMLRELIAQTIDTASLRERSPEIAAIYTQTRVIKRLTIR